MVGGLYKNLILLFLFNSLIFILESKFLIIKKAPMNVLELGIDDYIRKFLSKTKNVPKFIKKNLKLI